MGENLSMKDYKFYLKGSFDEPVAIIWAQSGKEAIEIFKAEYADFIQRVTWAKIEVVG